MEWNKISIKELRLRMGWSHTDMARRLNCEALLVAEWEKGAEAPTKANLGELEMISRNADRCSMEVGSLTQVEEACSKRALDQVDFSSLDGEI